MGEQARLGFAHCVTQWHEEPCEVDGRASPVCVAFVHVILELCCSLKEFGFVAAHLGLYSRTVIRTEEAGRLGWDRETGVGDDVHTVATAVPKVQQWVDASFPRFVFASPSPLDFVGADTNAYGRRVGLARAARFEFASKRLNLEIDGAGTRKWAPGVSVDRDDIASTVVAHDLAPNRRGLTSPFRCELDNLDAFCGSPGDHRVSNKCDCRWVLAVVANIREQSNVNRSTDNIVEVSLCSEHDQRSGLNAAPIGNRSDRHDFGALNRGVTSSVMPAPEAGNPHGCWVPGLWLTPGGVCG